jgi:hypothetical protein
LKKRANINVAVKQMTVLRKVEMLASLRPVEIDTGPLKD